MYKMEEFIQASVLIIFLTISAVFQSGNFYFLMLLCGCFLLIFSARSLSDSKNKFLLFFQFVLSIAFVIRSGTMAYLIFYEYRFTENRFLKMMTPPFFYFIIQLIISRLEFWQILLYFLLLGAASVFLFLMEQFLLSYLVTRNRISQAVSASAVNELYEKKLNQELVIKNYLADKNARLEEREIISRNIHNSAGHSLTAAVMTLEAADMLFFAEPDKARQRMNLAKTRIHTAIDTIRHAVRVLDNENQFVSMEDFMQELSAVADNFAMDIPILEKTAVKQASQKERLNHEIAVHTDFSKADIYLSIPHEYTEFLIGAVQELLTNGIRHGNANTYQIYLDADTKHIKITVLDNGKSDFSLINQREKINNGFGLKKLDSYVKKCGGTIFFANENGFKTVITLPLYKEELYE